MDTGRYSKPIVRAYETAVDELLLNLARHFNTTATGNTYLFDWDTRKLAELGALDRESAAIVARHVGGGKLDPMVRLAVETAMLDALKGVEPGLAAAARKGLLEGPKRSETAYVRSKLEAYSRQAMRQLNLVNTVMLDGTLRHYRRMVSDLAPIMRQLDAAQRILNAETAGVILGAFSRQEALRRAVQKLAGEGLKVFIDHGGHRWSPEAYVNMDIRTTCGNAATQAVMDRNAEYGNDLVWIRAKAAARPKCYPYQGRVFSTAGRRGTTLDLNDNEISFIPLSETSYGEPDGLLGINCGHAPPNPFIPGYSKIRGLDIDAEENDRQYAEDQKQRKLERDVRYAKREAAMLDAAGDKEGFEQAALTVKRKQEALNAFAKSAGLPLRSDKTQVFGYNRSVAGKAGAAAKRSEHREDYLKNVKLTLPKVAKIDNSMLQSTMEVTSGILNGVIPRGATIENVRVIAGYRTSAALRDAKRLSAVNGGGDYLWDKLAGTVATDAFTYEIHWYENAGKQYEAKLKGFKKK